MCQCGIMHTGWSDLWVLCGGMPVAWRLASAPLSEQEPEVFVSPEPPEFLPALSLSVVWLEAAASTA